MPTIFDRIVTKENDHTNLLRNLMDRNARFAAAVMSRAIGRKLLEEEITSLTFDTQQFFVTDSAREIPDLVIAGENIHCIIEAKIDPFLGLTEGQRNGYRNCFPSKGERYLAFLVPDDWKHKKDIDAVRSQQQDGISVSDFKWSQLIKICESICGGQPDEMLSHALEFWKWRFQPTNMNTDERKVLEGWSPTIYHAIRKLEKTVDQAKKLFDTRGFTTEAETGGIGYHGFYIRHEGRYILWVGIWTDAKAPLAYGYDAAVRKTWIKPSERPPNAERAKSFNLWQLGPECWGDPENIFDTVSAFLKTYWGIKRLA